MSDTWHLYVVRTVDDRLYAGIALDVARRFAEHRAGGARAAKYLRAHPPAELAWSLAIGPRGLALRAEQCFKRMRRTQKNRVLEARELEIDPDSGALRIG